MIYLLLTHDVAWGRNGPSISHTLARRERFEIGIIHKVIKEGFNPYFGIPNIMDVEEKLGVYSTFFFRVKYNDGSSVELYEDVIKDLIRSGWEVGLHNNDVSSVEAVKAEKKFLERIVGKTLKGCRVHYLRINLNGLSVLKKAGFLYDSSIVFSKDKVDVRNAGYMVVDGLVEFPITFMDAYLFTYMGIPENKVIKFITTSINEFGNRGIKLVTLLWHDSSINMRGAGFILNSSNTWLLRMI